MPSKPVCSPCWRTPAQLAAEKRYERTRKGRIRKKRYQGTPKGRASLWRYRSSEKYKRGSMTRYNQSPKGRARRRRYTTSPLGKLTYPSHLQGAAQSETRYESAPTRRNLVETALIAGDFQIPCHDPWALEVFMQIGEVLKPDILVVNGDFVEWRHLSTHYMAKDIPGLGDTVREETDSAKAILTELCKRVRPRKKLWNDGNHEWRLFRALAQMPQVLKLLGMKEVSEALSVDALLGISERGFVYSGEYPAGTWLFGGDHARDVYVHHSYQVRKKAGYQAHSEIDTRLCSVVTGHGERLGVVWRRGMDRDLFACEGGNLSILGEPKRGADKYGSVPFNKPEYLDRKQGFIVVTRDGNDLFPEPVSIKSGKAHFRGKIYKA